MTEAAFLQHIADDPSSAATTWLVLADWLEERGDARAELVRLRHDPRYRPELSAGQRDERVQMLLAAGVTPCVPTVTNSVGMTFALIPAGQFLMGSPETESERYEDEGPQHELAMAQPFWLGIHPVTQQQYEKVMGKNPSRFTPNKGGGPTHPVEQVSWGDATAFCGKLSAQAEEQSWGRLYRLPTEAEWEYACRGGAACSQPFSVGVSLSSTQANFNGEHPYGDAAKGPYRARTSPVGSYRPNAWGLYDMHGNVWDWCQDWYDESRYLRRYNSDQESQETGHRRVLRGGSWISSGRNCRTAYRYHLVPGGSSTGIGFRVVCVAAPRT